MEFTGIFVPLITPFDDTGAVAMDALERLAYDVLDAGALGIDALGTTGEPGSRRLSARRSPTSPAGSAANAVLR